MGLIPSREDELGSSKNNVMYDASAPSFDPTKMKYFIDNLTSTSINSDVGSTLQSIISMKRGGANHRPRITKNQIYRFIDKLNSESEVPMFGGNPSKYTMKDIYSMIEKLESSYNSSMAASSVMKGGNDNESSIKQQEVTSTLSDIKKELQKQLANTNEDCAECGDNQMKGGKLYKNKDKSSSTSFTSSSSVGSGKTSSSTISTDSLNEDDEHGKKKSKVSKKSKKVKKMRGGEDSPKSSSSDDESPKKSSDDEESPSDDTDSSPQKSPSDEDSPSELPKKKKSPKPSSDDDDEQLETVDDDDETEESEEEESQQSGGSSTVQTNSQSGGSERGISIFKFNSDSVSTNHLLRRHRL